jgi:alpha-D-ribose 1-methylphosphonate 5-triphosphate synthase subunit PhnI
VGYTAVKGGEEAIRAAERLERAAAGDSGLTVEAVERGLGYAVGQVMGEAGLYAPKLAALAVVEAQGDLAEAAFLLRAYRSTLPRIGYTEPQDTGGMRLIRRISSTFKDVPGGQILGPTRDYSQRLLGLKKEEPFAEDRIIVEDEGVPPRVTDTLRKAGLMKSARRRTGEEPFDLTRQALKIPAPRSGRLQGLARGEPGAMSALAYSLLRGFGAAHPALAEFRVGFLPLRVEHPYSGEEVEIGELMCTEVEAVGVDFGYPDEAERNGSEGQETVNEEPPAAMAAGYGLVFGRNERKAIAMANLDAAIRTGNGRAEGPAGPAEDEEFVLYHTDGIEATGFVEHLKLPHYVTFQSSLDRLREVQGKSETVHGPRDEGGGDRK